MSKASGSTRTRQNATEKSLKNDFRKDILSGNGFSYIEQNNDYYKGKKTALAKEIKGLYQEAVDTIKDTINGLNLDSVGALNTLEANYRERLSSLNSKISEKIDVLKYNADRGYGNVKRAQQAVRELNSLSASIDKVREEMNSNNNLIRLNEVLIKHDKWG